jgi:hypothetical protein
MEASNVESGCWYQICTMQVLRILVVDSIPIASRICAKHAKAFLFLGAGGHIAKASTVRLSVVFAVLEDIYEGGAGISVQRLPPESRPCQVCVARR